MLCDVIRLFVDSPVFDLIAEIFIPILSAVLICITYCNQRRSNEIMQFESVFWKLGGDNAVLKTEWYPELQSVNQQIRNHFGGGMAVISMSDLCRLLVCYWRNIRATCPKDDFQFMPYFIVFEVRLRYIYEQYRLRKFIHKKDIDLYISSMFSELPDEAKLPICSFLCSEIDLDSSLQEMLPSIVKELSCISPLRTNTSECKMSLKNPCSNESIYGDDYDPQENYMATLDKLNDNI